MAGIPLPTMLSIESMYWLIIILMEIPWGIFTAKYGYTRTLRLSFGMLLISKIVFALAGSYPAFLGERILLAVAYAGLSGCDGAYLYEARGDVPADKVYLVVGTGYGIRSDHRITSWFPGSYLFHASDSVAHGRFSLSAVSCCLFSYRTTEVFQACGVFCVA